MGMRRNFLRRERHRLDATDLSHNKDAAEAALVDRHATSQVGQRKRGHTVAAIGGADQIEQRVVLANLLQLAVTKRPVYRREVEAEAADFPDIRSSHRAL